MFSAFQEQADREASAGGECAGPGSGFEAPFARAWEGSLSCLAYS